MTWKDEIKKASKHSKLGKMAEDLLNALNKSDIDDEVMDRRMKDSNFPESNSSMDELRKALTSFYEAIEELDNLDASDGEWDGSSGEPYPYG